jgi:hypothetical protein
MCFSGEDAATGETLGNQANNRTHFRFWRKAAGQANKNGNKSITFREFAPYRRLSIVLLSILVPPIEPGFSC